MDWTGENWDEVTSQMHERSDAVRRAARARYHIMLLRTYVWERETTTAGQHVL